VGVTQDLWWDCGSDRICDETGCDTGFV